MSGLKVLGKSFGAILFAGLPIDSNAACEANDCHRELFPCQSPQLVANAVAFCNSLNDRYVYASEFPVRATGACGGTNKAQYLSACACGPTCTLSSIAIADTLTSTPTSILVESRSSLSTSAEVTGSVVPNNPSSGTSGGTSTVSWTETSPLTDSTVARTSSSAITTIVTLAFSTTTTNTVTLSENLIFSSSSPSQRGSTTTIASGDIMTGTVTTTQSASSTRSSEATTTTVTVNSPNTSVITVVLSQSVTSGSSTVSTDTSASLDRSASFSLTCSELSSFSRWANTTLTTVTRVTGDPTVITRTTSKTSELPNSSSTCSSDLTTSAVITVTTTRGVDPSPLTSRASLTSSATTSIIVPVTTTATTSASTTTSSTGPSCTPGLQENVGVLNGDFEDGFSPWSFDVAEPRTSRYGWALNDGAGGSCTSFRVSLNRTRGTDNDRSGFELFSPLYDVDEGRRYLVSFWAKFQFRNVARILLSANSFDINIATAIAWQEGTSWTRIQTIYVPTVDWIELAFDYDLNGAESNTFWIDRIQLTPAPPVSSTVSGVVAATFTASPPPASTDFTLSVLDSTPAGFPTTVSTSAGTVLTVAVSAGTSLAL
ncbi:putative CBM-cenC domain-containing protein [Seiridium cardinale]